MYELIYTGQFKKSLKKCAKRGLNIQELITVLDLLQKTGQLPQQYNPHKLTGSYRGYWECHIKPDWLLIWEQDNNQLRLILIDTGTHADLF